MILAFSICLPAVGHEVDTTIPGGEEEYGADVKLAAPGTQPTDVGAAVPHVVNPHHQQLITYTTPQLGSSVHSG